MGVSFCVGEREGYFSSQGAFSINLLKRLSYPIMEASGDLHLHDKMDEPSGMAGWRGGAIAVGWLEVGGWLEECNGWGWLLGGMVRGGGMAGRRGSGCGEKEWLG
jgi:hypothetical protein